MTTLRRLSAAFAACVLATAHAEATEPPQTQTPELEEGATESEPSRDESPDEGATESEPTRDESPDVGATESEPSRDESPDVGKPPPNPRKAPFQLDDAPVKRKPRYTTASLAPLPREEAESKWYGGQTLLVDGATVLLAIAASSDSSGPMLTIALLNYFFGPAVVHIVHGRGGAAALSPLLRLGLPLIGVAILSTGVSGSSSGDASYDDSWIGYGFLAGYAGAVAMDAAVLSYETVEPPPAKQSAPRARNAFTLTPGFAWTPRGGQLALSGTF